MKIRLVGGPPAIHEMVPRCLHVGLPAEFFECFDQTGTPIDNGAKSVEHNCPDGTQFGLRSLGVWFGCHWSQEVRRICEGGRLAISLTQSQFSGYFALNIYSPSTTNGQNKQLFGLGEHSSRKFTPRRRREHDRNVDRMVRFLSI